MKIKTKSLLMRIENRSTNTLYFDSTIEKKKNLKRIKFLHRFDQYKKRSNGATIASTITDTTIFAYTHICIGAYREREIENFHRQNLERERERERGRSGSKRERERK